MSSLVVALPDEDLDFLKAFSAAQGITAEAVLAGHARRLRELIEGELHSDVSASIGIIKSGDGEQAFLDHIETKHS